MTLHCRTFLPRKLPERYLYNRGQYDRLRNLMDIDWTAELENKSTQESWNLIVEHLQKAIAASIPKTRRRPRGKFKPLWMNGEALAKVKTKRDTWKRYKTTRDERDYKVYTRARSQARWATRHAVKQFEKSIAKEVKSNPKAFWKYAQSKTRTRPGIADLNVDGRLTITEKEKADVLHKCLYHRGHYRHTNNPASSLVYRAEILQLQRRRCQKEVGNAEGIKGSWIRRYPSSCSEGTERHHPHSTEPAISQITERTHTSDRLEDWPHLTDI